MKAKSAQKSRKTDSARPSHTSKKKGEDEKLAETKAPTVQTGQADIQEASAKSQQSPTLRINILRGISLVAVIVITIYIYNIREHAAEFEKYGYAGIFLIALMANATVLLPAPGVAIVYAMGAVFNPFWVALFAASGAALGELTGYLIGFSGQAVIERTDIFDKVKPWVDHYGGWAILVLSAIPNPFFDIAGVAAGMIKMKITTFLFFTWVGQIIKMSVFAFAGYSSLEWISNFLS
jgi:uncharacterized membrane protein YdjX (TVP38/TMEM64 family)